MSRAVAALSMTLWSLALSVSPAPVSAAQAYMNTQVKYFACGPYSSITPFTCGYSIYESCEPGEPGCVPDHYSVTFSGQHMVSFASACTSGCSGTSIVPVDTTLGSGRKKTSGFIGCSGKWITNVLICASCG